MSVRMKDIAEKVGVSLNTVSKAINNRPYVSEKTRELILNTADELNYSLNDIARSLAKKKTNTLGVLLFDIGDTYFAEVLNGIENIARKNGYSILLCNANHDSDVEYQSIKVLLEKRVDGLLISPTQMDNRYVDILKNINIPFILLNRRTDSLECNYVVNDYIYGSYIAVDYLIKKGYKDIYFIHSHSQSSTSNERIEGCKKACKKNKIQLDSLKIFYCDRNLDEYYSLIKNKINYYGNMIGIFVWDDDMSVGVYKAIIEKGLKVPEDVGIIGYDNIKASKYLIKPLTTINNPSYEIGLKAAKILIKNIKSENSFKTHRIVLKPELIIRETA